MVYRSTYKDQTIRRILDTKMVEGPSKLTLNAGSSIDTRTDGMYNNSPAYDDELRRRYDRDVTDGLISAAGVKVAEQSEHFLTRLIGTSLNPAKIVGGVYFITVGSPQDYKSNA